MDSEYTNNPLDFLPPGTQRIEDSAGKKNWSKWRKALHIVILSFYAIMIFATLCVQTPLWQAFNIELGITYQNLSNGYAANMAALSIGCIIFVPLALKFGRRPVYIATSLIMLAASLWQAKMKTTGDMIGANFLSGIAGAVNEALFQITVSDLFFVHQRGTMNGIYLIVVLVGNYLGPVAAGYIAVSQGWRWVNWYCTIFNALVTVAMIFGLEESKFPSPPINGQNISRPTTHEVSTVVGKDTRSQTSPTPASTETISPTSTEPVRQVEIDYPIPLRSYWKRHAIYTIDKDVSSDKQHLLQHAYQLFQALVQFPAVMFTALQYGWCIAMLAILAVTQATLYPLEPYSFSPAGVGNMNIPPAIGAILRSLFGGPLVDRFILEAAKRRGFAMSVGSLMYGLTIAKGMPWIINAVGAGFIGFALGGCGDMALTYVQDSYQNIFGDAFTGIVFVRSAISTALIFTITPWMTNMGVYNMFVLLGVLAFGIAFTCVPLIVWGRRWRTSLADKYVAGMTKDQNQALENLAQYCPMAWLSAQN